MPNVKKKHGEKRKHRHRNKTKPSFLQGFSCCNDVSKTIVLRLHMKYKKAVDSSTAFILFQILFIQIIRGLISQISNNVRAGNNPYQHIVFIDNRYTVDVLFSDQ